MIPLFSSCSGEEKLLWIQRGFGVNAFYILPFIEIKIPTLFINHFWKRLRFYKTVEAVHMSRFLFQGELNQGYDIKELRVLILWIILQFLFRGKSYLLLWYIILLWSASKTNSCSKGLLSSFNIVCLLKQTIKNNQKINMSASDVMHSNYKTE